MNIQTDFINKNKYSRPCLPMKPMALVIHGTGGPGDFNVPLNFFKNRENGLTGYGSAHYIVGLKGQIINCIPENEGCYHVGHAGKKDPASGRYYTDSAREFFGEENCHENSIGPNGLTIGIELCQLSDTSFTFQTILAAIKLSVDIMRRNNITEIMRHHDIVGWKNCPEYFVKDAAMWELFSEIVYSSL